MAEIVVRMSVTNDVWEQLADTPHAQGAGDAVTWSEHDDHIYAMIGSNTHGAVCARYSYDSWETLTFNPDWTFSDDGASLASVGEYLYALRGSMMRTFRTAISPDTTSQQTHGMG